MDRTQSYTIRTGPADVSRWLQWEHRYYTHPYNIYGGSDIDTFPGWTRPASHAATDNIHTTRHSYVAIYNSSRNAINS